MTIKIIAVFHQDKCEGLQGEPAELGANPPMTMVGMRKIHDLVPAIKRECGETIIDTICCSRLARGLDAASILALTLNADIQTYAGLGQYANKDGDEVINYPGTNASMQDWQQNAVQAVDEIMWTNELTDEPDDNKTIIIVSHRPIIGGLVAHCQGVTDEAGIKRIVGDPALASGGYRVFNYDATTEKITLVK